MKNMKYKLSDNTTKTLLQELGEEYKDLLIEQILKTENKIDVDEINLTDLVNLDIKVKNQIRKESITKRWDFTISALTIVGCLYIFIGLILLVVGVKKETFQFTSYLLFIIILIFLGFFITTISFLSEKGYKNKSKNNGGNIDTESYEIVNKWKEVEALIRELTPDESSYSLQSMMENLKETNIISDEDFIQIEKLLVLRNQVVHHEKIDSEYSRTKIDTMLCEINKIIRKMSKFV